MITTRLLHFDEPAIDAILEALAPGELDLLDFGVIGFDRATVVQAFNAFEAKAAGLRPGSVVGQPLFKVVAPCMNNFMVAGQFEHAVASGARLDAVIQYVLTLRMRPTRVLLRLVAHPQSPLHYVLVQRSV